VIKSRSKMVFILFIMLTMLMYFSCESEEQNDTPSIYGKWEVKQILEYEKESADADWVFSDVEFGSEHINNGYRIVFDISDDFFIVSHYSNNHLVEYDSLAIIYESDNEIIVQESDNDDYVEFEYYFENGRLILEQEDVYDGEYYKAHIECEKI
jgi:hypothetical protein